MPITPLYAAGFALLLVVLSVRTLRLRRRYSVAIGPGREPELERAMRAHANFCEYVPIALLLIYFLEIVAAQMYWVHGFALLLLIGRIAHAYGVSQIREDYRFRVAGMAMTFTAILGSATGIVGAYIAI